MGRAIVNWCSSTSNLDNTFVSMGLVILASWINLWRAESEWAGG